MPYESNLDLPTVLRTTLSLLDNTDYPAKRSQSVANLRKCLLTVLAELSAHQAQCERRSGQD